MNYVNKRKISSYWLCTLLEVIILIISIFKICRTVPVEYTYQACIWNEELGKFTTEQTAVPKGIYRVCVNYKGEEEGACYAAATETGTYSLYTDRIVLPSFMNEKTFDIYANDDLYDLRITVEAPADNFDILYVTLRTAWNSKVYQMFCIFIKLAVVNIIVLLVCYKRKFSGYGYELLGVLVIGVMASAGVMTEYLLGGHDLTFHLLRIEGLKEGLLAGQFPVKIQPAWVHGWGYAVSIMYGDALLYIPAALRIIGITVQDAYKAYIVLINLATAGVAYYAFYKIAKDKKVALIGSCIYTMAPYRLANIYIRAAVGEYSAMVFMPLILLGGWYACAREDEEKLTWDKVIAPVIGFTGLIQTHVISCFMIAIIIMIFAIICYKRVFKKNVLIYLVKIAGIVVLSNLWFIVPFLQYMREAFYAKREMDINPFFQLTGVSFAEFFAPYSNGTWGNGENYHTVISDKFARPIGLAILLIILITLVLYLKNEKEMRKEIKVLLFLTILTIWMSSRIFPYYAIYKAVPFIGGLIRKIQFPFRFLTMVILFGAFLAVLVMLEMQEVFEKHVTTAIMMVVTVLAVLQGMQFIYSVYYTGFSNYIYSAESLDSTGISAGEYLYDGTWVFIAEEMQQPSGKNVEIGEWEKNGNAITVSCINGGQDAYIRVPLYFYPCYVAYDSNNIKTHFAVSKGVDGEIRVDLPNDYTGLVCIRVQEPILWRIAEALSLLFLLYIIANAVLKKHKVVIRLIGGVAFFLSLLLFRTYVGIEVLEKNMHSFVNVKNGQYLSINGETNELYLEDKDKNSYIELLENEDGSYIVQFVEADRVLDLQYGGMEDGNFVQGYGANGSEAQKWRIIQQGESTYVIMIGDNLAVTYDEEMAAVIVKKYDNQPEQQWIYE